ncbi:unnamed protein product [Durusdinium trenchii]|uniref:Fe2OG dioxygenase domain-containing protein n=2 Tax=Durusdinium trenchii TaxID=1381693 RepID=A0ABP0R2G1_9DINO
MKGQGGPAPADYGAVESGENGKKGGIVTEEERAKQRAKPSWKDLPPLLLPWFLFGMVLLSTALVQGSTLCILALSASGLLSIGFLVFSRAPAWKVLSFVCMGVTAVGWGMGLYDEAKYLYPFHFYERSPSYLSVDLTSKPGSVGDAGFLRFQDGTHVDSTRGVGFVSGALWCAAPVVQNDSVTSASYWAVGKDCCRMRAWFNCGDAMNQSVRSGVVIRDASPILKGELPQYMAAARMAAETYGMNLPPDPVFIRWNDTPEANQAWYWNNAVSFVIYSLLVFLLLAPLFLLLLTCTGASLFGMEASERFHPEKLDLISFGFDWTPRAYPGYLRQDLLNNRSFWTGEIIEDYLFHAANRHVYLSCLLSHPAHPYKKWQRIIVAGVATVVSWSLVAAVSTWASSWMLRNVMMIFLCLTFRNALKLVFISYGVQTDSDQHVHHSATASDFSMNQLGLALLFILLAVSTCGASMALINANAKSSSGEAMSDSTDVFAYMYVLDFLVDLFTPYLGRDNNRSNTWAIGFFGRWVYERNEFESAKSQMQNQKFRWSSLGAEVFGVGSERKPGQKKKTPSPGPQEGQQYLVPHGTIEPTQGQAKKLG